MSTATLPKSVNRGPKKYDPKSHRNPRPKPPAVLDGFITRAECAVLLRCTVQKVDHHIAIGTLNAYQFGRNVLLKRAEVMASVEANPL